MKWRRLSDRITRLLHPRLTVLVTSRLGDDVNVMTASWVTPVSANPPIVAVSIAPERKTFGMIVRSGEFALNVLEMEYLDAVYLCGRISGKRVKNKFKKAGLTPINARKIGAPAIKEASAVLECEVWKTVEAGDHVLFLGEVIEAYASEKFDEIWRVDEFKPIFHVGGRKFAGVGGEILAKEGK